MSALVQQLVNGIISGSVYSLVAIGITLIFGLTGLVNFAHGDFMMVGAYIALSISSIATSWAGVILSLLVAGLGLGVLGVVLERLVFARTLRRPINGFVISLGLILVIENIVAIGWGTNPQTINAPLQGSIGWAGIDVSGIQLLTFVVALLLSGGFYLFLTRTRTGTAIRCCNVDRDTAFLMGINVPAMQTVAFGVGTALAGTGGVLLALSHAFTPYFGSLVVVQGFVIALAGGLGNVYGAFWVALMFGVAEALTVYFGLSDIGNAVLFGLIVALLMVRPTGLFGGSHGSSVT